MKPDLKKRIIKNKIIFKTLKPVTNSVTIAS